MECFSENEIYSLQDISSQYNLDGTNPILYALYLELNPDLTENEKTFIKNYIQKIINKQQKINEINIKYMEKHLYYN